MSVPPAKTRAGSARRGEKFDGIGQGSGRFVAKIGHFHFLVVCRSNASWPEIQAAPTGLRYRQPEARAGTLQMPTFAIGTGRRLIAEHDDDRGLCIVSNCRLINSGQVSAIGSAVPAHLSRGRSLSQAAASSRNAFSKEISALAQPYALAIDNSCASPRFWSRPQPPSFGRVGRGLASTQKLYVKPDVCAISASPRRIIRVRDIGFPRALSGVLSAVHNILKLQRDGWMLPCCRQCRAKRRAVTHSRKAEFCKAKDCRFQLAATRPEPIDISH